MSNNNSIRSYLVHLANNIVIHLDEVGEQYHQVIEYASEFLLECVEAYDASQDNPGDDPQACLDRGHHPFTEGDLVQAARVVFDFMCEHEIPCPIPGGVHARFETDTATGETAFSIVPAERDVLSVEECFSAAGLASMVLASDTDYIN